MFVFSRVCVCVCVAACFLSFFHADRRMRLYSAYFCLYLTHSCLLVHILSSFQTENTSGSSYSLSVCYGGIHDCKSSYKPWQTKWWRPQSQICMIKSFDLDVCVSQGGHVSALGVSSPLAQCFPHEIRHLYDDTHLLFPLYLWFYSMQTTSYSRNNVVESTQVN